MMLETADIAYMFRTVAIRVNSALEAKLNRPVFFEHGVYDAVNRALVNRANGISEKRKYPLIWLVTPVRQVKAKTDGICELPDLQLFILMDWADGLSEDEYVNKVFQPYLRPIYRELLHQIDNSYFFQVLSVEGIPHEMTEWSLTASTPGVVRLFDDKVCAIQIKGMRLIVNESVSTAKPLIPNK
jgi:hypothetical protein